MATTHRVFNLHTNGLQINSATYEFPISIEKLSEALGQPRHFINTHPDSNDIFTWDDSGIYVYSKNNETTDCIAFLYKREFDAAFLPTHSFNEELRVEGEALAVFLDSVADILRPAPLTDAIKIGPNPTYFAVDEQRELLNIQFSMPAQKQKKRDDKYKPQKVNGPKLIFSDFNFKLAVMQVLMYEKGLLKPKFDLDEFARLYAKREIDLELEGYSRIAEAVAYFEDFEIASDLASEITQLHQDGGDDIYLNLICFWDGEDDGFAIRSARDAHQFPNLKNVTVFGNPATNLIAEFEAIGISVA